MEDKTTPTTNPTVRENKMKKPTIIAVATGLVIIGGLYASKYVFNGGQSFWYSDGVYTAEGKYISPGGNESIDVQLTLEGNIITNAEVTGKAENPISIDMQNRFISGYKDMVVGKNINEVMLDKVSGSSLTPKGFMDALENIKDQAQIF